MKYSNLINVDMSTSIHYLKLLLTEKLRQNVSVSICVQYITHTIHTHTFIAPHHSYTEENCGNSKSTKYNGCVNLIDKEYKKIIWTLWGGGKMESKHN